MVSCACPSISRERQKRISSFITKMCISNNFKNQDGLSLLELCVVILVMGLLATFSIMSLSAPRKYYADDQATRIVDIFNEARQMALNQRRIFRVEINRTKRQIVLINENAANTANDDAVIKRVSFNNDIVINDQPPEVTVAPPTTSPAPVLVYSSSNYPLSSGEEKITLRFRLDGQVVDAGNNNTGGGSLVTGATIYIYTVNPKTNKPDVIRAVTVLGASSSTAIYKCVFNTAGNCGSWVR